MSIFCGTIHQTIAAQLKAREQVISKKIRNSDFLQFSTAKNSWVRMISGVDVYDKSKKAYTSDLAKKWTLEGGVPFNNELRYGIGKKGGVYNSDLDNQTSPPFGFRPMPGITSISIINKGAYGSLRQATVRFQCWDKDQLDQLEKLYMRVGYTIFLEWGWSLYINHEEKGIGDKNTAPATPTLANFIDRPIDPFQSQSENDYFDQIDKNVLKYRGNYDAMIGYIQNFSWQILPNGGFDCSTTIISRGEVLTEIKNSSNPYTIVDSNVNGNDYLKSTYNVQTTGDVSERSVLSLFEKIFLNIKAAKNQSEIYSPNGEFYVQYEKGVLDPSIRANNNAAIASQVNQTFTNIKTALESREYKFLIYNQPDNNDTPHSIKTDSLTPSGQIFTEPFLKPVDGSGEGVALEYITFNELITILNTFFIPKNSLDNKPVVEILLPVDTPCLVCEDSVSIDPRTCLINNQYAEFITDLTGSAGGFQPTFYSLAGGYDTAPFSASFTNGFYYISMSFVEDTGKKTIHKDPILKGNLGNIFISISKIIEVYRRLMTSDGVSIIDYLQELLEDISLALGGINDFKVHTSKNKIILFDAKYLETSSDYDGSYNKKFKFDLIGLQSICRDIKINSRIFSEQSSMIAIGAMASGEQENLGDIYSSTQQAFNNGLKDRVIKNIFITDPNSGPPRVDSNGNPIDPDLYYYYDIFKNIVSLRNYLRRKCLGEPISGSYYGPNTEVVRLPSSEEISNASSLLSTYLLQFNGKDLDFKAIIPLELEITLDGISGLIIGQIFTIDTSILPTLYKDNNVGFIITGISHTLQNNDWTTTVKTQMCLINNDQKSNKMRRSQKDKLKKVITSISTQTRKNSYLTLAMADYLTYLTVGVLYVGNPSSGVLNKKENKLGYDQTKLLPVGRTIQNSDWSGAITIKSYIYEPPDSDFYDQTDLTLEGQNSVNKAVQKVGLVISTDIPFYDKAKTGGSYLEKWFSTVQPKAASLGLPDFPATFDELINVDLGGGSRINLEDDLVKFNIEVIETSAGGWNTINPYFTKGNQIFFYKYFGATPLRSIKANYYKEPGVVPPVGRYGGSTNTVGDLLINKMFSDYLFNRVVPFINRVWTSNARYVNPYVYGSTIYSLESVGNTNPSLRTTSWWDGVDITAPPPL